MNEHLVIPAPAALVAWTAWTLWYWGGGTKLAKSIRRTRNATEERLLILSVIMFTAILLYEMARASYFLEKPGSPALGWLSLAFLFVSLLGTVYCRAVLGVSWAPETQLSQHHLLVVSGPYAHVRHPIFLCAIGIFVSTAGVLQTWTALAAAGATVGAYVFKTRNEDTFLLKHLEGYSEYATKTRYRLVPGLW